MEELKPCPFCGGKARISFKDYLFMGRNYYGDAKKKYRVQAICNRCHSRGKPIITDWLINPDPYATKYCRPYAERPEQDEMFNHYIEQAIEAWNRRMNNADS